LVEEQAEDSAFRVTAELMAAAAEGAVFLHGAAGGRGAEVVEEVFYSANALTLQAAENHLWVAMAVCMALLGLPWEEG
jgi:ornithine carbamoyltransferase